MRATRTVVRPGRRNGGTTLVFRLTRPAVLRVTVFRVYPSCERVGTFSVHARPGVNRVRFRGRLGGRPLRPGGYRLIVRARGAQRDAAAVPIVIARGRPSAAALHRARTGTVCTTAIADFSSSDPDMASPGANDEDVLGAAATVIKAGVAAPIAAVEKVASGAKGVSRTAKNLVKRVAKAADDPFENPVVLTMVGLSAFLVSLLGLLVLAYLARLTAADDRAGSRSPS